MVQLQVVTLRRIRFQEAMIAKYAGWRSSAAIGKGCLASTGGLPDAGWGLRAGGSYAALFKIAPKPGAFKPEMKTVCGAVGGAYNYPMALSKQTSLRWGAFALPLIALVFFFYWMEVVTPRLQVLVEGYLGRSVFDLPIAISLVIFFVIMVVPPFAIAAGVYVFVYFRWFIPNRSKLVNEQVEKLAAARNAMREAVSYIETYEVVLKEMSAEVEALDQEVRSLKLLNSENIQDLELKLKAMNTLALSRIWFERIFAFVIGVLSSLVASYLWLAIQPR